jgi:hypothetical protein
MNEPNEKQQNVRTLAQELEELGWTEPLSLLERWHIADTMPESMNGYRIYPNGGTEGMTIGEYLDRCEKQKGAADPPEGDRPRPVLLTEDDGSMAEVVTPGRSGVADDADEDE